MKFEITPEQAEEMKKCIEIYHAASKTLHDAMAYHTMLMRENEQRSDAVWDEVIKEHGLDMNTHDWMFQELNGVPYVIGQARSETKAE